MKNNDCNIDQLDNRGTASMENIPCPDSENLKALRLSELKRKIAILEVQPSHLSSKTIQNYSNNTVKPDSLALAKELEKQIYAVKSGDLNPAVGILMSQISTMNSIFHDMAIRASEAKHLEEFEAFIRSALKAQNQCRVTLETIASIKNPSSVAFVKQANIGYNQQVNNGPLNLKDTKI